MYRQFLGGIGLDGLFAMMDEINEKRKLEEAGITIIDGLYGLPRLNIPHKYHDIKLGIDGYIYGLLNGLTSAYDSTGKFLFECTHVRYYNYGMFLVGRKKEGVIKKGESDEFGYSLYHNELKLTEPIFRPTGMSERFNEFGFAVVGIFDKSYSTKIINKAGEIVFEPKSYHSPYLHGVVCSSNQEYTNLLTGETICKGYETMYIKGMHFVKVDINCVYQINLTTGEYIVHGELKPKVEPKPASPAPVKKEEPPKVKLPNRNDVCLCGSGKKYKYCCIDKHPK